jgi:hypothetical protein
MPHTGRKHPFKDPPPSLLVSRRSILHAGAVSFPTALFAAVPDIAPMLSPRGHAACDIRPSEVRVILTDFSDPPESASQANAARALIRKFLEESELGAQWLIFTLMADPLRPLELLEHVCDPGRAREIEWGPWARNGEARRRDSFVAPMNNAVERAFSSVKQKQSPLIEASKRLFSSPQFYGSDGTVPKRLLLITDAMQHTEKANAYKGRNRLAEAPDHLAHEQSRAYVRSQLGSVANVHVRIGFLNRPIHQQLKSIDVKAWIDDYLIKSGITGRPNWFDLV